MTDEDPLGIMLYGYDEQESSYLRGFLVDVMNDEIILLSASGKEESRVQDILGSPSGTYESKEEKVLMFLGFDDEKIGTVLDQFPRDGSIRRPIFCALTQENLDWQLKKLIEHLLEEDKQWKDREMAGPPSDD